MTDVEAVDDLFAHLTAAWAASGTTSGIVMSYEGDGVEPPSSGATAWARSDVREVQAQSASITGADGTKRYVNRGILRTMVYVPQGTGRTATAAIGDVFKNAFRDARTTGGATFKNVRAVPTGTTGPYLGLACIAEYEYDTFS